jgi:hypothetical protein
MREILIDTEQLNFKAPAELRIPAESESLVINNVFGINTEGEMPVRFLSGFISTFELAKTIQEGTDGEIVPRVRIFRPLQMCKFMNGITEARAESQIQQGNEMLSAFADHYFPDIEFGIEDDQEITPETISVLGTVKGLVEEHCDEELLGKVKDSGRRRGGEQGERNAMWYVAHHPFGWQDAHHPSVFATPPAETTVNTLPPSERAYAKIRETVRTVLSGHDRLSLPTTQRELYINMCGTPHYLFVENGAGEIQEPSMRDVLSITGGEVLRDMEQRFKSEKDKYLKDNLRRVHRDTQRLMQVLSGDNTDVVEESTFEVLLKGGE